MYVRSVKNCFRTRWAITEPNISGSEGFNNFENGGLLVQAADWCASHTRSAQIAEQRRELRGAQGAVP